VAALTLALVPLAAQGCSDNDPAAPAATIVGTWQASSFEALGTDFIEDGMTLRATFQSSNTYSFVVTGDMVGICPEEETECTDAGNYSATATQVTIDPGLEDEVTFTYALQGNTMTWTGSIEENPASLTFTRVQ
jgi:hypothetical protein